VPCGAIHACAGRAGQRDPNSMGKRDRSDVMMPIAAPMVGGMITSTIHVLILVPVFFAFIKERALWAGTLGIKTGQA
jgi:hypothetical protein